MSERLERLGGQEGGRSADYGHVRVAVAVIHRVEKYVRARGDACGCRVASMGGQRCASRLDLTSICVGLGPTQPHSARRPPPTDEAQPREAYQQAADWHDVCHTEELSID